MTSQIDTMFQVGAHFGYGRSSSHPSTKDFIYGNKDGTQVFDLTKTVDSLDAAKKFLAEVLQGGKVVLVGSKNEARDVIQNAARSKGMPYVTNRWIGGTLTNFDEIKKQIKKLESMIDAQAKGEYGKYTKKEQLHFDKSIEKMKKYYEGLLGMYDLPKAVIVVDPDAEHVVVAEAKSKRIPVIALANSDCDITGIDYPIVANDTSIKSIEYFVNELMSAV